MAIYPNIKGNNIFSEFPVYKTGNLPALAKSPLKVVEVSDNKNTTDSVEIKSNDNSKQRKRKILFGSTLASAILTASVLSLVFVKGIRGSAFSKIGKSLSDNLQKLSKNNPKDIATKTVYYSQKGTKKVVDVLEASSNFTALKDFGADKLFKTNKVTTKFADGSTAFFKKTVDNTLGKKYDKAGLPLRNLTSLVKSGNIEKLKQLPASQRKEKITIKGETRSLNEWINLLSKYTQNLQSGYDENFSLGARRLRDESRKEMLVDLPSQIQQRFFKDKKSMFTLANYKTYATSDLTKNSQGKLASDITAAKKKLTNNIGSISDELKISLNKISENVNIDDKSSGTAVQNLKSCIEQFKTCSGNDENKMREEVCKKMKTIISELKSQVGNSQLYTGDDAEKLLKSLTGFEETLTSNTNAKGALEEIMTILNGLNKAGKHLVSDESYNEIKKISKKISKNIEKATELEMGEYFLKQAELKVGSAPTDVLSVLFPVGVGAYSIAKGEDKEEKISAALTTCIPLVGTFATFVYGTVKMLSGAKNLMFSAVTGLLLGELGNYADKLYKNYKEKGSVSKVVKDEYKKVWTGLTTEINNKLEE